MIQVTDRINLGNTEYINLDARYTDPNGNPFSSVSAAQTYHAGKMNELFIGFTVLVKESGWTEAKEYWVQPYDNNGVTAYHLVEKGAGTTDYADLDNKPTISDGGQGSVQIPLSGNIKVTATAATSGQTTGVAVTAGQNGGINIAFTLEKGETGAKGAEGQQGPQGNDGKSAYQLWLEANGFSEAEHPIIEYINSLKSHVSGFVPVAYNSTAAGKTIGQTYNFALENPVDGSMVLMPNAESSATGSIMFAVSVDSSTTPATVTYTRVGNVDIDVSGFAQSSDIVNNLNDGGTAKMLSAEQGVVLNNKHYRKIADADVSGTGYKGYISNEGKWVVGSTTLYRKLLQVPAGVSSVKIKCNNTEGTYVSFIYSFGSIDTSDGANVDFADGWTGIVQLSAGKEYRFEIPTVSETGDDLRIYLYVSLGYSSNDYARRPSYIQWGKDIRTDVAEILEHNQSTDAAVAENAADINSINNWLTVNNINIPLPSTMYKGWIGTNNTNWRWNADTNANKVIRFVCLSIGENGDIDNTKFSKVTLTAQNTATGYINWHLTANKWKAVGLAYTFMTELVEFPTNGNYLECEAGTFCEGYKPGTANATSYSSVVPPFKTIAKGESVEVDIPSDAAYLVILVRKSNQDANTAGTLDYVTCGTKVSCKEVVEQTQTYPETIQGLNERIDNIADEIGNGTTIFDFNPIKEVAHKVHQARRQSGFELANENRAPLWGYAFMHVSDCHGGSDKDHSKEQWGKLMEYAKALRDNLLIDDVVDTGDVIEARFSQFNGNIGRTISDWRADDYDETKKVLTVIGNHDTRGPSSTDTQGNWRDNIGKNVYDVLMADIDEWDVEQPEDAAENGLCYYYKDYTRDVDGTTYTLRALFLDMMGWGYKRVNGSEVADNSQREWVWGVLSTARENNMMVVVFCHEIPAEFTSIRSSMSSKYASKLNSGGANLMSYNPKFKELAYLIHYHMVLGGRFAGYVCGHSHTTFVGKISGSVTVDSNVQTLVNSGLDVAVADSTTVNFDTWGDYYPQRACVVDTTQVGLYRQNTVVTMRDGVRIKNTDSEHSFWIVNISTGGVISLIKIGFHLNKYYQKRDVLRMVGRVYGYFSASTEYSAGSIVSYADNKYYRITSKHSVNVTWENTSKEDYPFIFDGNFEYAAGNIVSKDGNLWRFLSPAVSGGTTDWAASDKELYSRVISE